MAGPEHPESSHERRIADAAAAWVWKLDRGLSAREQDAFFSWLAESPEHAESLARHREYWRRVDPLGEWRPEHSLKPNPDLLAPPRREDPKWLLPMAWAAVAAAVVGGVLAVWNPPDRDLAELAAAEPKAEIRRMLEDGSTVKLNAGAEITVDFAAGERRVRLVAGEAFFMVAKDPSRPFLVEAGGVVVRAVGTAFNVRLGAEDLNVLVAEGVVEVVPAALGGTVRGSGFLAEPRLLEARQRASIPLAEETFPLQVDSLTRREIQQTLAWQHGIMTFEDRPLAAIVEELNRLNDTQLVLVDGELAATLFSGSFRSDNVEGFVRLLEKGFGATVERAGRSEIVLRGKN